MRRRVEGRISGWYKQVTDYRVEDKQITAAGGMLTDQRLNPNLNCSREYIHSRWTSRVPLLPFPLSFVHISPSLSYPPSLSLSLSPYSLYLTNLFRSHYYPALFL
ncbi:unnamed protein product, partial [Nezara viridula]